MQSTHALPDEARNALRCWAEHIRIARKRRQITIEEMARRMFISDRTYRNVENGDPGAGVGHYVTAMYLLGLHKQVAALADPAADKVGQWQEQRRLPKRVRRRQETDLDF